ncbi:unnamed protein product [Discosporangium mesarthrocarpum]
MYDWVYVDEKWFYVMKDGRGIYLHPEEDAPKPPRAQNKRFITKVMFLAAVSRPRMISDGVWFDAQDRYLAHRGYCGGNAQPSHDLRAAGWCKAAHGGGVMEAIQAKAGDSIILETQPANSPDLNVNDLGFFHSIQQLKEDVGVSSSEVWWRPQWRTSISTPGRH